MSAATLLVIPCFRERDRLPRFLPLLCEALRTEENVRLRVVDDGSGPEEQAWLCEYIASLRTVHPFLDSAQLNDRNLGKGGAIYSGWSRPEGADSLAFADADGAVSAEEIVRLIRTARDHPGRAVYAVRTGTEGTQVRRSWHRRIAGSVFRFLVRNFFRFPLPDTQCGCKIIPGPDFAAVHGQLTESGFAFDIDLTWHLLRRGVPIVSVPIHWTESPGTRLRAGSALAMYRSIRKLRRRLGDWHRA